MNNKIIWILIASVCLLVSCATYPSKLHPPIINDKDKHVTTDERECFLLTTHNANDANNEALHIVGLGDSLTVGVGDEKAEGGYIGKVKKMLSRQGCPTIVTNHSSKGFNTTDLLQSLQDENVTEAIADAHIITITIGANDLLTFAKKEGMKFTKKSFEKAEQVYTKNIEQTLIKVHALNEDALIYLIGFYNPISSAMFDSEQIDLLVTKWNNINEHLTAEIDHTYFIRIDDVFSKKISRYLADDHFHPNHLGYEKIAQRLMKTIQNRSE